jgi:transcription factor SPN1
MRYLGGTTWTAKKLRLDMEIDTILKSNKASWPKKRKKEDDLDQFADAEVSQLREEMLHAAELDEQANREKLPATLKLKLLSKVMGALRKCVLFPQRFYGNTQISTALHVHRSSLWQSIVDNNLLEGVRRWLEPLPDKSLPALNIQREIFSILPTLDIDTAVLKESKLGRIVLFYTKCKRVTPDITRTADQLVSAWSRPIIKRSASYRDRAIPMADMSTTDGATHERLNVILARAKEGERHRVRKNAVMIPQRELGSYTVAPRSNAGIMRNNMSVDMDIERRKRNVERLKSLTRKMGSQRM